MTVEGGHEIGPAALHPDEKSGSVAIHIQHRAHHSARHRRWGRGVKRFRNDKLPLYPTIGIYRAQPENRLGRKRREEALYTTAVSPIGYGSCAEEEALMLPSPLKPIAGKTPARSGRKEFSSALATCQIVTPEPLIGFLWERVLERRENPGQVIDLGAGDGRFAWQGRYSRYVGVEIDEKRIAKADLPPQAHIREACVLDLVEAYEVAVGNPPFVRNQELSPDWRRRATTLIEKEMGVRVHGLANLYIYFMWLALMRTKPDGLVVLIVPFDWILRPSSRHLRRYVQKKGWAISVFQLNDDTAVFDGVKTTATVTVIDKAETNGILSFFDVDKQLRIHASPPPGGPDGFFEYTGRDKGLFARRGYSLGSQEVFVLTETERRNEGIGEEDVLPCVTSLRHVPGEVEVLNKRAFKKRFIDGGRRCWLLSTSRKGLSSATKQWLERAPESVKTNSTCSKRPVWWKYADPPSPRILYSAGFVRERPKILRNDVGARALGSVHGIFATTRIPSVNDLVHHLRRLHFEGRVFPHSGGLRKIEVGQMNGILQAYISKVSDGSR